jgi:hypothetical protein
MCVPFVVLRVFADQSSRDNIQMAKCFGSERSIEKKKTLPTNKRRRNQKWHTVESQTNQSPETRNNTSFEARACCSWFMSCFYFFCFLMTPPWTGLRAASWIFERVGKDVIRGLAYLVLEMGFPESNFWRVIQRWLQSLMKAIINRCLQ